MLEALPQKPELDEPVNSEQPDDLEEDERQALQNEKMRVSQRMLVATALNRTDTLPTIAKREFDPTEVQWGNLGSLRDLLQWQERTASLFGQELIDALNETLNELDRWEHHFIGEQTRFTSDDILHHVAGSIDQNIAEISKAREEIETVLERIEADQVE